MRGDVEGWVGGGREVRLELGLVEALRGRVGEQQGGPDEALAAVQIQRWDMRAGRLTG